MDHTKGPIFYGRTAFFCSGLYLQLAFIVRQLEFHISGSTGNAFQDPWLWIQFRDDAEEPRRIIDAIWSLKPPQVDFQAIFRDFRMKYKLPTCVVNTKWADFLFLPSSLLTLRSIRVIPRCQLLHLARLRRLKFSSLKWLDWARTGCLMRSQFGYNRRWDRRSSLKGKAKSQLWHTSESEIIEMDHYPFSMASDFLYRVADHVLVYSEPGLCRFSPINHSQDVRKHSILEGYLTLALLPVDRKGCENFTSHRSSCT